MIETELTEVKNSTRDVYAELAEYKLQNRMLTERLDMMTSIATHYMEMRADLCQQLEAHGFRLAINNELIKWDKQ